MARGFVCPVALLNGFSRKGLAWRLSTALETRLCIEALEDAMRHGEPEIMNSDQGSQVTSIAFIKTPKDAYIQVSINGKGARRDNVISNSSDGRSNTKRPICAPRTACRRPGNARVYI